MARGRKKNQDPPIEWSVNMPQSLAADIDEQLIDGLTGKVAYGARSQLIQTLLKNWLAAVVRRELHDPPLPTPRIEDLFDNERDDNGPTGNPGPPQEGSSGGDDNPGGVPSSGEGPSRGQSPSGDRLDEEEEGSSPSGHRRAVREEGIDKPRLETCRSCRYWQSNGTMYGGVCRNIRSEYCDWIVSALKDDCPDHTAEPTDG